MDLVNYSQYMFGLVIVALLLALFAIGLKKFATSDLLSKFTPNTGKRLSVVETLVVDPRRRLVLVRHDDKEHLLLVGGESDLVIDKDYAHHEAPDPFIPSQAPAAQSEDRST